MHEVSRRVLMLTPDQGFLDRRIAQEAASIAGVGHSVDIYGVFGALPTVAGELAQGVRMLPEASSAPELGGSVYRRARGLKRSLQRVSPGLYDLATRVQFAFIDLARVIAESNGGAVRASGPYDVVFAHDIPVLPLAQQAAMAWHAGLVCDLHEVYPEQDEVTTSRWTRGYWRRIEHDYLPSADRILCVNPAVKEYVERRYGLSERVDVVYNSVPYAPPEPKSRGLHELFGIDPTQRIMVFAGTLRPNANLEQLVEGFAIASIPGWSLALLGSGVLEERLEGVVRSRSANDRIFLGKRVNQPDLIRMLSSADAGVVPYTAIGFNHEIATPNKLFEYVQARLPIASSRLPQIERILTTHHNGDFVGLETPEIFARDIRRFVEVVLPTITSAALEETARQVCWERDEQSVLRAFRGALRARQQYGST